MTNRPLLAPALAAGVALLLAPGARAAEARCWFENGAVVIPAEIAGVAGDWLLDPSAPHTLLHETRAQMEGLPPDFAAHGRVAGVPLDDLRVTVADLDGRAPGFPTPIAGVIGADVLGRFVVDLDFTPCRIRLAARGRRLAVRGGRTLPLAMVGGVPTRPPCPTTAGPGAARSRSTGARGRPCA